MQDFPTRKNVNNISAGKINGKKDYVHHRICGNFGGFSASKIVKDLSARKVLGKKAILVIEFSGMWVIPLGEMGKIY